ncbi:hypothetical protein NX059_007083 [Plenodomus lindquistii]|nr:hypothetical protein NX059_007083 [Plenodomus lindquistii]
MNDIDADLSDLFMCDTQGESGDRHGAFMQERDSHRVSTYGQARNDGHVSIVNTMSSRFFDFDNDTGGVQTDAGHEQCVMMNQSSMPEHALGYGQQLSGSFTDLPVTLESSLNNGFQHLHTNPFANVNLWELTPTFTSDEPIVQMYDYTSRPQGTIASPGLPAFPQLVENHNVMIGYLYSNPSLEHLVFKCSMPYCNNKSFKRCPDLTRHYNGAHTNEGKAFWCDIHGCERSNIVTGRSFPRKDKLKDHKRQAHGVYAD